MRFFKEKILKTILSVTFLSWLPLPLYLREYFDWQFPQKIFIFYPGYGGSIADSWIHSILYIVLLFFMSPIIEMKLKEKIIEKHISFFHAATLTLIMIVTSIELYKSRRPLEILMKVFIVTFIWSIALLQWFFINKDRNKSF